ncbi:MAG: hypothetical protein ACREUY_01490, partial [Burkholderiales bacterium]
TLTLPESCFSIFNTSMVAISWPLAGNLNVSRPTRLRRHNHDVSGTVKRPGGIEPQAIEYECGAVCTVAAALKAKMGDGIDLIEAYTKESGLWARHREAARKAMGLP